MPGKSALKTASLKTRSGFFILPAAPNLLNQNFQVDAANRAWVADLTYVSTKEGWLCLAAVMVFFTRHLIGWAVSSRMVRGLPLTHYRWLLINTSPHRVLFTTQTVAISMPRLITGKSFLTTGSPAV
jgi:putative transposase